MTDRLSALSIVRAVAKEVGERIARKVMREMLKLPAGLLGDDSGLKTAWDEVCVQIQYDQTVYWDAYEDVIHRSVAEQVEKLAEHEAQAIWLQTGEGTDWQCEESENREPNPMYAADIINYIAREYVYREAGNWSNRRIRTYIEVACVRD